PKLASVLFDAAEQLARGEPVSPNLVEARAAILAAGYAQVEYLELRAEEDLRPLHDLDRPARLLVAAWLGETRLIDNVRVLPRQNIERFSRNPGIATALQLVL
ncbi:MAG: hypothetical protein EOS26_28360, partial [Mesorhizobium sp.]